MNQIEKLYLDSIEEDTGLYTAYSVKSKEGKFISVCSIQNAATKAAVITEQFVAEFTEWSQNPDNCIFVPRIKTWWYKHNKFTTKELFKEYLKERQ